MTKKRLSTTPRSLKALFAKSGNVCSFPGCEFPLVGEGDNVFGEVCHIEAASPKGPRYNPNQTDDERRGFDNLILLCPNHHIIIDVDNQYTVEMLKKMKSDHELQHKSYNYQVDNKVISKLSAELEEFWQKIEYENTVNHRVPFIALELKVDATFSELFKEIRDDFKGLTYLLNEFNESDKKLAEEVPEFLDKHGVNSNFFHDVFYKDNPFIMRNLESHSLGVPNFSRSIKSKLDLIELKCLELHLSLNPDDIDSKKRMEELKEKILHYAGDICYND